MKLLHKTLKIYLIFSLIIFIISIPVFFFLVQNLWIQDVDESLMFQKEKIVNGLNNSEFEDATISRFTELSSNLDIGIKITPIYGNNNIERDSIRDNSFYDNTRLHVEPFRELNSIVNIDSNWYKILIRKDLVEKKDLIKGIIAIQIILFLIFMTGTIFFSSYFSKKTWNPFYFIVSKLENYKINSEKQIEVVPSDIKEFNELNQSVQHLTRKNIKIYKAQKEFTENAAHETQTPLSVIKNQLDLLAQDKQTNQNQAEIINKIDKNINLLTKLNRNLLLLANIENNQFGKTDSIILSEIINEIHETFSEYILMKGIKFTSAISTNKPIKSNAQLVHSLITNLMTNAIRHNIENGIIEVSLKNNSFCITNTADNFPLQKDKIFERFYKQSNEPSSVGLGLAIVKKICDNLDFKISYIFNAPNKHTFKILFY